MKQLNSFHQVEDEIVGTHVTSYKHCLRLFMKALNVFDENIDEFRNFVEMRADKLTVFDFDLSKPEDPTYEKNRLLTVLCLMPAKHYEEVKKLLWDKFYEDNKTNNKLQAIWGTEHNFAGEMMIEMWLRLQLNCHGMSWYSTDCFYGPKRNSFAVGLFPSISLVSHSCAPNCDTMSVGGNKLLMFVTRPIKAGGQIFISYG